MTSTVRDDAPLGTIDDDELSALALAADPDTPVAEDAVCLWELTGTDAKSLLPEWYMPTAVGGGRLLHGWRRRIVFLVIAAFLTITAYGLCNTYGQLDHFQ
ncbi:MAG: hypothetical protein ACRDWD_04820 [Acidimicrobiia bacterium]